MPGFQYISAKTTKCAEVSVIPEFAAVMLSSATWQLGEV